MALRTSRPTDHGNHLALDATMVTHKRSVWAAAWHASMENEVTKWLGTFGVRFFVSKETVATAMAAYENRRRP